mmetsp:Transcript_37631/g.90741  ORF Transcript_37631/g.90741 Transcript_37631/m.90741 type:complete len:413 (-) Transcript_37631:92-1330(-)|eukprot:CAMPEP_0181120326 /NCGR_PEP_ID=MMETSP1071-20121207/24097_1 /TAXON_ID=35127 /ORGANISM="Thalassiosira sp., Strain NH16" /LENGTH=412 /DNA_ID=CAMNT_0023204975 /DNA_START=292 /DNA_END=1530 /DNA_ORIENTATION=-
MDDIDMNNAPSDASSAKKTTEQAKTRVTFENANHFSYAPEKETDVDDTRLVDRAKTTRLTAHELGSKVQPGRNRSTFFQRGSQLRTMGNSEKLKTITIPKILDFFVGRMESRLITFNVTISVIITALSMYVFPESWNDSFEGSNLGVVVLGSFLSFAMVFRTQTCYSRWWEARVMWGRMTAACVQIAGQARTFFGDEVLVDRLLLHLVVFPYASKAVLRGNLLKSSLEEGPRFLESGMLTSDGLNIITRHGIPPFTCLDIIRRTTCEALQKQNECVLPSAVLGGAFLAMEQSIYELVLTFGACLRIKSTKMPSSYNMFMRSFVIFYFVLASLHWAPTIKWLTPILVLFLVFLINTVIVIGDQMLKPFDVQWSGLPLQKLCVVIEKEIMNAFQRHGDIDELFAENEDEYYGQP